MPFPAGLLIIKLVKYNRFTRVSMTFLKKTILILIFGVFFSACSNQMQAPPAAESGPITMFTQEQLAALSAYFGISLRTPASAEQTKIVPGAAKNGIQVTAASVLSYADAKGTERAGNITARLSGTYDGRQFQNVQAVFTGFEDVYGSNVRKNQETLKLNAKSLLAQSKSIDEFIAAAKASPATYVDTFTFILENGTNINALDMSIRSYTVENILFEKTDDAVPSVKVSAQYKVHYFSRERDKDERAETVDKDSFIMKIAYPTTTLSSKRVWRTVRTRTPTRRTTSVQRTVPHRIPFSGK